MGLKSVLDRIIVLGNKYKYVALIILIGIILMTLPLNADKEGSKFVEDQKTFPTIDQPVEERLASILSKINGAGNVMVMLTTSTGEEILYQVDSQTNERNSTPEIRVDTVIVSDKDRKESGLIRQINPPKYLGAIVVCQGADDPNVQLSIIDAVSKVTGLGSHKISVLKMN